MMDLEEIQPFHSDMWAQKCTKYDIWYKASGPYILDFRHVKYLYLQKKPLKVFKPNKLTTQTSLTQSQTI